MSQRLSQKFKSEWVLKLLEQMSLSNSMAVPKITKIVVSAGIGKFKEDAKMIESASADLKTITGQKPRINKAKKAISAFKLRANDIVGLEVTLRGDRMWSFFDKMVNVVLPRVRDFRGVNKASFDGSGNITIGFKEHTVFPEIDVNKVDKVKSFAVTVVTSAGSDEKGAILLTSLGFPFKKI